MQDIIIRRTMLIPWDSVYDLKTKTLTGAGDGDPLPFTYPGIETAGDLLWIIGSSSSQSVTGEGIDPAGYDDRFGGLYLVEDAGNEDPGRNWRLRRAPVLDSTAKYKTYPRIWLMSDPVNTKPVWSPLGTPCDILLPLFFEMDVSPGPKLGLVSFTAAAIPS